MIKRLSYYFSDSKNPYHNLAMEELLANSVREDEEILYLWQNSDTVVVGKHQNVFTECNYNLMKNDNISLARRKTGGGAVFHDDKNLNFTFISAKENYDVKRNQKIIQRAIGFFGLQCEISGRNDITLDGKKFSGNAFFVGKNYAIHHGTIMIDVDISKLEKYLTVSKSKLLNKGVSSVRSRVVNLITLIPDITVNSVAEAFFKAFQEEYGKQAEICDINSLKKELMPLETFYGSEEWLMGTSPVILAQTRKDYGEIILAKEKGVLTVFSDALDVDIIDYIKIELKKNAAVEILEKFSEQQKEIINDINELFYGVNI